MAVWLIVMKNDAQNEDDDDSFVGAVDIGFDFEVDSIVVVCSHFLD